MPPKSEMRNIIKAKRKALTKDEVQQKSKLVENEFLKSDIYKKAESIMLYMPIQNEVDTSGIIKTALSDGKKLVFPVTENGSGKITPFFANSETEFVKGNFSVPEPICSKAAKPEEIDVILVPGIAFDSSGNRIGFGKGCYDKFLSRCTALRVGVCYDFQLCERIAADVHDKKMDYILSENGLTKCSPDTGE